jgi:hypothetical protein
MTGSSQNIQPAHRGWRRDHRRTIALCGGWPRADSAQRSEDLRGLVRLWPGGDREVSRAGDGGSLTIFSSGVLIFNRANIGLSISAGVENRGMVDALGAAVVRRCVHVGFGAGSAGRTMMSLYCGQVHGSVGSCGYKHHHRQLGVGRRMVHRLDPGCSHRPGFLVRKLACPGVEHLSDGRGVALAPARAGPGAGISEMRAPILCDRFIVIPSS